MNGQKIENAVTAVYSLMTDLMMLSEEELRYLKDLLIEDAMEEIKDIKQVVSITGMASMVEFLAINKGRLQ